MDNIEKNGSEYVLPSKWCEQMQERMLELGNQEGAYHYFTLANQWKERGL